MAKAAWSLRALTTVLTSPGFANSRTNFAPQAFRDRDTRSSKTSPTAGPIDASCTRSSPNSLSSARASFGGDKWWRQLSVRAGPCSDDHGSTMTACPHSVCRTSRKRRHDASLSAAGQEDAGAFTMAWAHREAARMVRRA